MNIEIKKDTATAVLISVDGEIDMSSSPELRNALLPYFEKDLAGIVVDLSGVSYMDSSGIATMIEGLQWSTNNEKKFILAGLTDKVMDVFVLTNLNNVFTFSEDSESAFNDIGAA